MKPLTKKIFLTGALIIAVAALTTGGYFLGKYWQNKSTSIQTNSTVVSALCGDGICQKVEQIKKTCEEDCLLENNNSVNNNTETNETTKTGFVVIHMEPGTGQEEQKNLTNPKTYWTNLVSLIETADQYKIKLTLLFNPQWAEYILQDPTKLSLLRGWETAGHEIGYHQHEPSRSSSYWNGYTNQTKYQNESNYFGTIDDATKLLTQLPADGKIYTAGVSGADDDLEIDWPVGVPYRVDGIMEGPISTPEQEEFNGQSITSLHHQIYIPGEKNSISLDDLQKDLDNLKTSEYFGIVFHGHNFTTASKADYEKLFQLLNNGLNIKTVKDILTK